MTKHQHRLRELEALRAVVTAGTTVGAAQRLNISQSAVSRALSQLESRIGLPLFVRKAGRIEPTAEALKLNGKLDPIFDTLAQIEGADWSTPADEPLRLIVPQTLAHHFLVSYIAGFLRANPGNRVQLDVQSTDVLLAGILDLRYDLGLTSRRIHRSGVALIPLRRSDVVCALPKGHALAAKETITPKDLDGIELIEFLQNLGTRAISEQMFAEAAVQPRIVAETSTNMSAMDLVREGLGVTLINPFPILMSDMKGVEIRPFSPVIPCKTNFVVPAGRPPTKLAQRFMRYVKLTTPKDKYSEPAD